MKNKVAARHVIIAESAAPAINFIIICGFILINLCINILVARFRLQLNYNKLFMMDMLVVCTSLAMVQLFLFYARHYIMKSHELQSEYLNNGFMSFIEDELPAYKLISEEYLQMIGVFFNIENKKNECIKKKEAGIKSLATERDSPMKDIEEKSQKNTEEDQEDKAAKKKAAEEEQARKESRSKKRKKKKQKIQQHKKKRKQQKQKIKQQKHEKKVAEAENKAE